MKYTVSHYDILATIIEKMEEKGYSGDRQSRYKHIFYEDKETHIMKTKINFVVLTLKSAIKFEQDPPKPWNIKFDKDDNEILLNMDLPDGCIYPESEDDLLSLLQWIKTSVLPNE